MATIRLRQLAVDEDQARRLYETFAVPAPGVTEFIEIPGRGHALTIDDGWQEVADTALTFIRRFA